MCALCSLRRVDPAREKWHLDHDDLDRSRYLGADPRAVHLPDGEAPSAACKSALVAPSYSNRRSAPSKKPTTRCSYSRGRASESADMSGLGDLPDGSRGSGGLVELGGELLAAAAVAGVDEEDSAWCDPGHERPRGRAAVGSAHDRDRGRLDAAVRGSRASRARRAVRLHEPIGDRRLPRRWRVAAGLSRRRPEASSRHRRRNRHRRSGRPSRRGACRATRRRRRCLARRPSRTGSGRLRCRRIRGRRGGARRTRGGQASAPGAACPFGSGTRSPLHRWARARTSRRGRGRRVVSTRHLL